MSKREIGGIGRMVLLLAAVAFAQASFAADIGKSHEAQLAEARRFAAEKSWALARDAYAEAARLAPDAEAKRWCELWGVQAEWRGANADRPWGLGRELMPRVLALLAPYEKDSPESKERSGPRARDDFFWETMALRLGIAAAVENQDRLWELRVEMLGYLMSETPSENAKVRLVEFLRKIDYSTTYSYRPPARETRFAGTLGRLARSGLLVSEERAWCALLAYYLSTDKNQKGQLQDLAALCEGTSFKTAADAAVFVAEVESKDGKFPDVSEANRAAWEGGFAGLLARARELRAMLPAETKDFVLLSSAKGLDRLIDEWCFPHLAEAMARSFGTKDIVEFAVGVTRLRNVRAELYSYAAAAWRVLLDLDADEGRYGPIANFEKQRAVPGMRLIDSMPLFPNPPEDDFAWQSGVFRFEKPLAPGFYTLALIGENGDEVVAKPIPFVVSDARVAVMVSPETGMDLHVLGKSDGLPLRGATVEVFSHMQLWGRANKTASRIAESWSGKTDDSGCLHLPTPTKEGGRMVMTVVANGHPVHMGTARFVHYYNSPVTADLFLDRPLYRPGETVHWKLIARKRQDGRFVPCDESGKMGVSVGGVDLLKDESVTFNAFGTAHGKFEIPQNIRPSFATWKLKLGKDHTYLRHSFAVDNFVPPAMKATAGLASSTDGVVPGKEVEVKFNLRYYSGGGAADVPVEFNVYADVRMSDHVPDVSFSLQKRIDLNRLLKEQLPKESRTDGNGDLEIRLALPKEIPDGTRISITGFAKATGMADVRASVGFTVSEAGVFANSDDKAHPRLVVPKKERVFSFTVVDAVGKPRAFEGKAVIAERRWLEIWLDKEGREVRGEALAVAKKKAAERQLVPRRRTNGADVYLEDFYGDDAYSRVPEDVMPEGWRKVFANYVVTTVSEQAAVCGADGRVDVRFAPPHEGIFEIRLEKDGHVLFPISLGDVRWNGGDPFTRPDEMRSGHWMFVAADEKTKSLAFKPGDAMILGLEKNRNGRDVEALLVLPENCADAYFSVAGETRVLARRVSLQGRVGRVSFGEPLVLAGRLNANLFDFVNNRELAQVSAKVPDASTRLAVSVAPTMAEQRPGERAEAVMTVKDSSGKPVRAELAVAVADKAVVEMSEGKDARERESVFVDFARSLGVHWRASINGEQGRPQIQSVFDGRPGALALALHKGGGYSSLGEGDESVLLEAPSAGKLQMAPPLGYAYSPEGAPYQIGIFAPTDSDGVDLPKPVLSEGIRLRRHFAWTAFWEPELVTDADGTARVSFNYPDNLTQWRIAAYAIGEDGNTFGIAQALTRTSLPLQARVLAPRFLIEGDEADLTGLLVNRMDEDLKVSAQMAGEGALDLATAEHEVATPKQDEARVSWRARARETGEAAVTLVAKAANSANVSDAMRVALPVLEDGIRQDTAACSRLAGGDKTAAMTLPLPSPLNRERLKAELVIAQGRVAVMLDALPYLIDYPHGCVEQTMSRFLPAVVVKKTLVNFGFDAAAVERRIMTKEPDGMRMRRERSAGLVKLDDVVAQSLAHLYDRNNYRHDGYGWWMGGEEMDLWMTAYVAWGLQLAQEAGVEMSDKNWLRSVREAVQRGLGNEKTPVDRAAWALFVLSEIPVWDFAKDAKVSAEMRNAFVRIYAERDKLPASGRACLLAASMRWGTDTERAVLLRNLENGVQRTAHGVFWGTTGAYWRASEGAVETTALTVLALLKAAPSHKLTEPALDWLVMNRRGTGWHNTRASAFAVLALARAAQGTDAGMISGNVEVFLNEKKLRRVDLSEETLLAGALRVPLPAELLRDGDNRVELRRGSSSTVGIYATALASAWASGDSVKAEGNMLSVSRDFSGQRVVLTLGGGGKLQATAMAETGLAQTGDEVTANVRLSVPGELEYVMVTVPKPAGCEPLNPLSGWDAELLRVGAKKTESRRIYREEHDDHSAFFLSHIDAGEWEIRFRMRAVTSGNFRALPVKAEAMYVPEIRANSDARRIRTVPAKCAAGQTKG